jgi:hypothetical protein
MPKKLTDETFAACLKGAVLPDKQEKMTKAKKGTVKTVYYSFAALRAAIVSEGITITDGGIRQRVYAVNDGLKDAGVPQVFKAYRVYTGRKKKVFDASLFTV